jgi:ABC-type Fe3+-hydroxamate transport system substrate-binding protein
MPHRLASVADAQGTHHPLAAPGARVACLVPSITELLLDLGLGGQVVARTGYCIHPAQAVASIPKVGGTKDVNLAKLRALNPAYVIVNIDENRLETAQALAEFVPHVVVTHPQTLADNLGLFRLMGALFAATPGVHEAAQRLVGQLEQQLLQAGLLNAARKHQRVRVLYLIWQNPWMTISPATYAADVLRAMGAELVVPRLDEPGVPSARYPAFGLTQVDWSTCDVVLLSSEPFRFGPAHQVALAQEIAALSGRLIPVELVDGEPFTWYGSRSLHALPYGQALMPTLRAHSRPD